MQLQLCRWECLKRVISSGEKRLSTLRLVSTSQPSVIHCLPFIILRID